MMGALEEAIEMLLLMKQKLPVAETEIQIEIWRVKFLQGLYEKVLYEALPYMENNERIRLWILEQYYEPFRQQHQNMLQKNFMFLKQYKYYYGEAETNETKILWYDGGGTLVFEHRNKIYKLLDNMQFLKCEDPILACNFLNMIRLLKYIRKIDYTGKAPNVKIPLYLYYDCEIFDALIQCVDWSLLLSDQRLVIIAGSNNLRLFFEDNQVLMPASILGPGFHNLKNNMNDIFGLRERKNEENLRLVQEYYHISGEKIIKRIKLKKPRILFLTSRFTTILQYHIRDLEKAARKMGLETKVSIERDDIFRIDIWQEIALINAFKPDIIFSIDHFRDENKLIPSEVVWITWIQDPMPHIMDKSTPEKLGEKDYILNHYTTWKRFKDVGYPQHMLMDAPIPASSDVYREYVLSTEEYKKYSCDICFVCHASDVDQYIEEAIEKIHKFAVIDTEIIYRIYRGYEGFVKETGLFFYSEELFRDFIDGSTVEIFHMKLTPDLLDCIAQDMYQWFNQRLYRQTLVDWILDAGFTNLKLWGSGWKDNEKYQAYAMGVAENGETLSKIYQASKIVIGNNIMTTTAARVWETMLSGGFYLGNYIPEEEDVSDIRKILEVGKDMIMFHGKEDLIEKIDYYLKNEKERKIMAERGKKFALEKMTYDILMKRTLSEIAKYLED